MSSQPSNFRRTDVKRAVQAVQAAGLKVGRVELHGGKVLIIPAGDEEIADYSNKSFADSLQPQTMVLYHATRRSFVAKIRRRGLKPHVPGKVWGLCDPELTRGKLVVWLTADPTTWRHAKHPNKAFRDPDSVLLTILISWNAPKLQHYMSWVDPRKKKNWLDCPNNPAAWFLYFGTIPPKQIIWR